MIKIAFSFDDTGSMASARRQVRSNIIKLVEELFKIESDLQVAIAIHNDYCDKDLLQLSSFMTNKDDIVNYINRSSSQGGGDSDEAYAYVLNKCRLLPWDDADKKVLVMIGDANPHEKGKVSAGVKELYDWREECSLAADQGIKIYSIQALGSRSSAKFYETMANLTNGIKLDLSQFDHINQYITAILHSEAGTLDEYENSNPVFKTNISFKNMFNKLQKRTPATVAVDYEKLSKFQVMEVKYSQRISEFVEASGATYKKGRGFYELVNPEIVQADKQVIFVDRATGEYNSDTNWCRAKMGLPYGTKGRVSPRSVSCYGQYKIFIQSNSYTRNLDPGTSFLYELNHI